MTVQLNLSKDEFQTLLRTVYYAALCNANDGCQYRQNLSRQIDSVTDLLLNKAVELGFLGSDRVYAQSHGESSAIEKDIEEDQSIREAFEQHCENVFWDELVSHMVGRDLAHKYGDDFDIERIPQDEQDLLFDRYEKEITINGAKYLTFKSAK